jgi:hypothetical protein
MNFSWNKSNGGGESLITYANAGGGSNIRFGVGYWNNTTYSEQFSIISSGNVGIGTTAPLVKLRVQSSGSTFTTPDNNDVAAVSIYNSNNSSANAHAIISMRTQVSGGSPFISFDVENEAGYSVGMDNASNQFRIAYGWNSLTAHPGLVLTQATSPNVLIGTTTDAGYKLDVNGNTNVSGGTITAGAETTYAFRVLQGKPLTLGGDSNYAYIQSWSSGPLSINSQGNNVLFPNASTNVGIGTTAPGAQLDITKTFNARAGAQSNPTGGASVAIDYQTSSDIQGRLRSRDWDGAAWKNFTIEANNILLSPAGNVGIGTTEPVSTNLNSSLTIYKSYNGDTASVPSVTAQNYYENQSGLYLFGRNSGLTIVGNNSENNDIYFANASNKAYAKIGALTGTTSTGGDMYFNTGGNVEAMRITTSGNVGIGTTNPLAKLHVSDTTTPENAIFNTRSNGGYLAFQENGTTRAYLQWGVTVLGGSSGNYLLFTNDESGGNIALQTRTSGGVYNSSALVIDSNGNVGIGTTSPVNCALAINQDWVSGSATVKAYPKTTMASGGLAGFGVFDSDGTSRVAYMAATASNMELWAQSNMPMNFGTNDTQRMRITAGGNVLINTTTDSGYKLDVNGTARVSGQFLQGSVAARSANGTTIGLTYNTAWSANTDPGDEGRFLSIVNESSVTNAYSALSFRVNPDNAGGGTNAMLDMKFVNANSSNASNLIWSFLSGGSWFDRMALTSGGNLGIGTTSPSSLIHGKGIASSDVTYRFEPIDNNYKSTVYISSVSSGDSGFRYDSGINQMSQFSYGDMIFYVGTANISGTIGDERLRIKQGGNVGIGTTSRQFETAHIRFVCTATCSRRQLFWYSSGSRLGYEHLLWC